MIRSYRAAVAAAVVAVLALNGRVAADPPQLRQTLRGHSDEVRKAVFSPDGKWLATQAASGAAVVWDLATGKRVEVSGAAGAPVMFTPDGTRLVLSSDAAQLWVYALATGKTTSSKFKGLATGVSPTGQAVLCILGGTDYYLMPLTKPYDLGSGRNSVVLPDVLRVFKRTPRYAFTPDGKKLLAVDGEERLMVWDVGGGAGKALAGTAGEEFLVSPDGRMAMASCGEKAKSLVVRSPNLTFKVFDLATGDAVATLATPRVGVLRFRENGAFSPDGRTIACPATYEIKLWDAKTGGLVRTFDQAGGLRVGSAFPGQVRFVLGGRAVLALGRTVREETDLHLWDVATGKVTGRIPGETKVLAVSPDGAVLATGTEDGAVRLYDLAGGKAPATPAGKTPAAATVSPPALRSTLGHGAKAIGAVTFSGNGKALASYGVDGELKLWDLSTRKVTARQAKLEMAEERETAARTNVLNRLSPGQLILDPTGKRVAWNVHRSKTEHAIQLWSPPAEKAAVGLPPRFTPHAQAFSPDGKWLAVGCDKRAVLVWDLAAGKLATTPVRQGKPDDTLVHSVAFSPDGKALASGRSDGTIDVWEVDGWKLKTTLKAVKQNRDDDTEVRGLAFSHDGKLLASEIGEDLKAWDLATGRSFANLNARYVLRFAFAPDNKTLIFIDNKTIQWWATDTNAVVAKFPMPEGVSALSADGKALATGNEKGEVQLWDLPAGK